MDENKLYVWFGITGVICLATLAIVPGRDYFAEWKGYQKIFYEKAKEKTREGKEGPPAGNIGVRQIVAVELGRVDRCPTCHMAVEAPGFTGEEEPYRYHAKSNLHSFDKFGCTVCHEGQGRATVLKEAHGYSKHWGSPMLPLDYLQASCGKCHFESELEGAPLLVKGRKLYKENNCDMCHKISGKGESTGPDLTFEGSKTIDEFNFGGAKNIERTPWAWHFAHFKNPQLFDPNSTMPNLELTDEEAKALTVYMLSLTKEKIPYEYITRHSRNQTRAVTSGDKSP
jgi:hypothetical protein